MPGISIHPKIEGSRGMLRIMYPRYPLQIYGSFPIHLREKSSDPENIPSGPADFFAIIPLRRRGDFPFIGNGMIAHWKLGICSSPGLYIFPYDYSQIMLGICPNPGIEASRREASNNVSGDILGQIQRSFLSISAKNHYILKIFFPAPLIYLGLFH